jgi:uncharacterized protein YecE (DUF72 family)
MTSTILLGTSGWSYTDWIGNFYPEGIKAAGYLAAYARQLPTVEIDSTFYGIPREQTVRRWAEETPDGFRFAAKFPQAITHDKALVDCASETRAFVDRMSLLGDKLGPLLLQFGYGFRIDAFDTLARFLPSLPSGFRYAVEIRHKSWLTQRFYDLLVAHGVALTLIDHPWIPKLDVLTADFTYIRWLGDRKTIPSQFDHVRIDRTRELSHWKIVVERIAAQGVLVYGYFNNHYAGHSPTSLSMFKNLLDERVKPAAETD